MNRLWIVAAVAMSSLAAPAQTRYFSMSSITGGVLVEQCERAQSGQVGLVLDSCAAYILGAADALSIAGKFCNSGNAWTLQAVAVTKKYIRDHPEKWSKHASFLVQDALSQAFPCAKKLRR
jgi:uncharacterized membrane protein